MAEGARTIAAYLANLPTGRREAMTSLRKLIVKHLPKGYKEGIQYGMIGYYIPLKQYPNTYNGQPLNYIALASQKNYMSLYLMCVYGEGEEKFRQAYKKTGKKLNMGKSCVRFKKIEDLPLDLISETIESCPPEKFIAQYERAHA